ncbi:MAG: phenylalanine--tRNA ligase subunit beta [Nitrososphaeraceae archaeon]
MAKECSEIPVIAVPIKNLQEFLPEVKLDKILNLIPYIGLDIEGIDTENVRIEYNPNRPDFSSKFGIIRALKGLLEIEVGIPNLRLSASSNYVIKVDKSVKQVRPYIVSLVAKRKENLTNEDIKGLIAMQEDLHNGIGRRRKKASIGIHNLDQVQFSLTYTTADENFSFTPLDKPVDSTIKQILNELDTGIEYEFIVKGAERYPIILDSNNTVLSFPPIVNSNATKISADIKNILVEVTATNKRTAEDTIAIIAMSLFDSGYEIQPVTIDDIDSGKKELTPNMDPKMMQIDSSYINQVLGLNLDIHDISFCLNKSRLGTEIEEKQNGKLACTIPRYRTDIFHQIDLVEEVAIGYGVFNFQPTLPWSKTSGARSDLTSFFNVTREILIGMGMLEILSFSLVSKKVQYELMGLRDDITKVISVDGTKSSEYEVLRDSLIPSLLQTLSHNIHQEYPQKLFEIGKVFRLSDAIDEHWDVGVVIAHNSASYTETKSTMQELLNGCFGPKYSSTVFTPAGYNGMFIEGRCANSMVNEKNISIIGEITPVAVENCK